MDMSPIFSHNRAHPVHLPKPLPATPKDALHIRGWPTEPRPLKKPTVYSVLFSLGEVVLVLGPLVFIGKYKPVESLAPS